MKKPITLVKNAAGIYAANEISKRLVKRTRSNFKGTLVKLAVVGVGLWAGAAITGAVFGAALGATWWVLTLPLYHPILTGIVGIGTYLYFKGRKILG